MKIIREAYFFLNVFHKIKQGKDWDHIEILVLYLHEIIDYWKKEKKYTAEILYLVYLMVDEFDQSTDLRKDVLTFSENDIKRLSHLILKSMEKGKK